MCILSAFDVPVARTQAFDAGTDSSRIIWDGENVLQLTDNSNVTKVDYTVEPSYYGRLISQKQGADSVYHHFDALGSTQQLTDAMGVPIDSYDYTAYGAGGPTLDAFPNLYQFVGELGYSADNPFHLYIRRRWYLTFFGRWASKERFLSVDTYVYVYVKSNPTNNYDPSGNSPVFGPLPPSPIFPILPDGALPSGFTLPIPPADPFPRLIPLPPPFLPDPKAFGVCYALTGNCKATLSIILPLNFRIEYSKSTSISTRLDLCPAKCPCEIEITIPTNYSYALMSKAITLRLPVNKPKKGSWIPTITVPTPVSLALNVNCQATLLIGRCKASKV